MSTNNPSTVRTNPVDAMHSGGFETTLHQLFEDAARLHADRPAISFQGQKWSYAELDHAANQIASTLVAAGVQHGDSVAILLEASMLQIASLFGVLKAGAKLVCLGPAYPELRLVEIVSASQASAIITNLKLLDALPILKGKIDQAAIVLTDNRELLNGHGEDMRYSFIAHEPSSLPSVAPGDAAYVAYTSGSTGIPKGIVQSHRSFAQFITAQKSVFQIDTDERLAQWASIAYDASYCEIFGTLCFGGTLCLPPESVRYNPEDFLDWIESESVTILQMVPSFARKLFQASVRREDDFRALRSVKKIFLAGEVFPPDLANDLRSTGIPGIFNLYGPTETVLATWYQVEEEITSGSVPIGVPFEGREILLLNPRQEAVDPGDEGEIYIRSPFLTLGYDGNEDESSVRYIQNPLHNDYDDPVFRTGDGARIDADGCLHFSGRLDRLVKLRGNRVEPGEIEATLRKFDGVTDCAAVVRTSTPKADKLTAKAREARESVGSYSHAENKTERVQVLVAYFTSDKKVSIPELRAFAKTFLPVHMVPQWFVPVQEFPLNANMKLDVDALPDPSGIRPELDVEYRPPSTELEQSIARIFENVLGISGVGRDDEFFDLGGESLMAMQVINKVRDETGYALSFAGFFLNQTVSRIAELIADGRSNVAETIGGQQLPADGTYALTHSQRGLWFLWKSDPNNPYYSAQNSIHFRGNVSVPVLKRAWRACLERHDNLTATFGMRNGEPVQTFGDTRGYDFPVVDLSSLNPDDAEKKMLEINRADVSVPFHLEKDLLFRTRLFKLSATSYELVTTYHEILVDLWGFSVLIRDLGRYYTAFANNETPDLEDLKVTFKDYVVWENNRVQRENLQTEEEFWQEYLKGELPSLNLPTDRSASVNHDHRGSSVSKMLDEDLSDSIRTAARESGSTIFMFLLSAFQVLLKRYSGQDEVIVGAPLAVRNEEGLEEIASWFLNMLPIRTSFNEGATFESILSGVKSDVTRALTNARYPFMWMLDLTTAERSADQDPIFRVMFNWQNLPQRSLDFGEIQISSSEIDSGFKKYDLALYAQEHRDQIYLHFAYLSALFDKATVQRIIDNFEVLLREMVADPGKKIDEYTYLTPTERQFLTTRINDTESPFDFSDGIANRFLRAAEEHGDDVALFFNDVSITYEDLHVRSSKLASYLDQSGIMPGDIVALHLERSIEVVVAILAVIKRGCTYVALDPTFPAARLDSIISETTPSCLITHSQVKHLDFSAAVINLDSDADAIKSCSASYRPIAPSTEDPLNIVYTSSSSGNPKGVIIPERAVLNRLEWMWQEYPFQPGDVAVLQKSYSLVAATWEIFGGLLVGIPTVIISSRETRDAALLWRRLINHNVTHLLSSPSFIDLILSAQSTSDTEWKALRFATTSAEPVTPELVKRWYRVFPGVPLYNLYGSSECSSNVTAYDTRLLSNADSRVPIGTPLSNCKVYIVDKNHELVPRGSSGEMCVSGACLSTGYLGQEQLTAETFIDNPFGESGKLYRTGDIARIRNDGNIELLGRTDRVVKIRGFRVDLDDIQSVLDRFEGVSESAISTVGVGSQLKIVAFVVTDSNVSVQDVREFLIENVPDYMIPTAITALESLPRTPSGKVDYRGLPEPDFLASAPSGPVTPPKSDTEKALLSIWKKILKAESIGVTDNFFDVGGNSLLAVHVFSEIKSTFGLELRIAELYRRSTVRDLAAVIDDRSLMEFDPIVELTNGSAHLPPLFCFHGSGSNVMNYHAMAQKLSSRYRVFGVQGPGLDGMPIGSFALDKMASFFLEEIVKTYPQGPYHLLGFCRGGLTAIEVARQMREQNRHVESITVIDLLTTQVKRAMRREEKVVRKKTLDLAARIRNHLAFRKKYAILRMQRLLCQACHLVGRPSPMRLRHHYIEYVNIQRFDPYKPKPYSGDLNIICTHAWKSYNNTLGWDKYFDGKINVYPMDGEHLELLKPPLAEAVADNVISILDA